MSETMDTAKLNAVNNVVEHPIKAMVEPAISIEAVRQQAEINRQCLVAIDYDSAYGTCGDERRRIGLLSGEATVEPRPSIFGGPDVYALAVVELTGMLPEDGSTARQRLTSVTKQLNGANRKSGGHVGCAANAGINTWLGIIASQAKAIREYARREMADSYDDDSMSQVMDYAAVAVTSGRYDDWDESVLIDVLGDEAGRAIEVLDKVDHEGVLVERNKIPGTTIDQTAVYERSCAGVGSFDVDDCYAESLEDIITGGPDAAAKRKLARHAREAIIAAVASVVPNQVLFEDRLVSA